MDLPFFDNNYAQIAHARSILEQATKEHDSVKLSVQREVMDAITHFEQLKREVQVHVQTIIPATNQAIKYASTYYELMQLNMIVLLEAEQSLLEAKRTLVDLRYHLAQAYTDIERAVGTNLVGDLEE